MTLYEQRVKRLHDHVAANKAEQKATEPTIKELRAKLDEKGIEYNAKAKKEELIKLLEDAE